MQSPVLLKIRRGFSINNKNKKNPTLLFAAELLFYQI